MEMVYVRWEDASAVDESLGWIDKEGISIAVPHFFEQVGFVFDCDPWAIVLTEAHNADQISPRTRIPLGMIRRFIRIDLELGLQEEET